MAKYRKRPVIIEAVQFDPHKPWPDGVLPWPDEHGAQPRDMSWGYINTLEGKMHVMAGDWIITGVANEVYNCKDQIFRATYEPVEEEAVEREHMRTGEANAEIAHMKGLL
jgi:hypothetical protein